MGAACAAWKDPSRPLQPRERCPLNHVSWARGLPASSEQRTVAPGMPTEAACHDRDTRMRAVSLICEFLYAQHLTSGIKLAARLVIHSSDGR